jgi:putative membrane protein
MIIRFILRALFAAVGLWLASRYVHGITVTDTKTLIEAALLLGVINAIVRPIVIFLTLPLTLLSLGLFLLVINACMLWLVGVFLHGFIVDGFVPALLGSLVVSIVSWLGSFLIHRTEPRGDG